MANPLHKELLQRIRANSGTPTQHTFLNSYLGTDHPHYPISMPSLRKLAKEWMMQHHHLSVTAFSRLLTSLIKGESFTEKCLAGILADYAAPEHLKFDPLLFDRWLTHLVGWAEVDCLCTGHYTVQEIPGNWKIWKPLLISLSKSTSIQKRRASLVLLCSPLRNIQNDALAKVALENVNRLKSEREILITKAISWVLRSLEKHHREMLLQYLDAHGNTLPPIALRETMMKIKTGRKTKKSKVTI